MFTLTWAVKADFQTTHTMLSPQYAELRSDPLSVGVLECKLRRAAYWTFPAQAYYEHVDTSGRPSLETVSGVSRLLVRES